MTEPDTAATGPSTPSATPPGLTPGAALVTGAAKRLGRAMALDLAAAGWSVAIHYHRSAEDAAATVAACREAGAPQAVAIRADLTDEAQTQTLAMQAMGALGGPLTLLVNNASVFEPDDISNATRTSWDRHLESNLRAPVVLTQAMAASCPEPKLDAAGEPVASGLVVNMLDQRVWRLTPAFMSYTVAKSALWTLTQTLAQALAPRIRVNGIGPGPTLKAERQSDRHFAMQRENLLLERGGNPEDVLAALRFLIASPSVTGQMIAVDGGQHLAWETPDIIGDRA